MEDNRPSFDEMFLMMCELVAHRSEDRDTKVGSIITNRNNIILSIGYNGFVRGFKPFESEFERPQKYSLMEHAERNAIYNAAMNGVNLSNAHSIYCSWLPCADCARAIVQVGIPRVVINGDIQKQVEASGRWKESSSIAHHDQTDRAGVPYFEGHITTVARGVDKIEEKIVAYLHDIVEDTDITLEALRNHGFSDEIY